MEAEFLRWLYGNLKASANVPIGIGDDAAVVRSGHLSVLAADAIVDGVHFQSEVHRFDQIGHKALAVNLSDVAAMGATPTACLLSLIAGTDQTLDQCKNIVDGLLRTASKYRCPLVGGDFVKSPGPLTLAVTVYGEIDDLKNVWTISGARVGDIIFATGSFGGSILRKHLEFEPRLDLVNHIRQQQIQVSAATDVSDGLAGDLLRLTNASSVGAVIDLESIPISDDAITLSKSSDKSSLQHALNDGEDFELLLTLDQTQAEKLIRSNPNLTITRIGQMIEKPGVWYLDNDCLNPVAVESYEH